MDALRKVQPPLTVKQLDQIQSKDQVFSEMEIERMELGYLITQRDNLYNGVESYYAHDSVTSSNDSLISILQQDPRLNAKYNLVNQYFAKKDTTNANQLLDQILHLFGFDSIALNEYGNFKQLYELRLQLKMEGKSFTDLNEQQQQLLSSVIKNPSLSLTEMNDLNALRQVNNNGNGKTGTIRGKFNVLDYNEPILYPVENQEKILENTENPDESELLIESLTDNVLMKENSLLIYPNPASSEINLFYNVSIEAKNVNIEINDVTGRLVASYIAEINKNYMKLDVKSFKQGLYYVILVVDGKRCNVVKLVIQ